MRVFVANFGLGNALWPRCHEASVALTYDDDDDSWPLWIAGDRDAYVAFAMAHKKTHRGIPVTKPVASRWFNLLSEVRDSAAGDVWIHREKDELWWTTTTDEAARIQRVATPWEKANTPDIYIVEKPTEAWTNHSKSGVRLLWSAIHPRARQFLFTEATFQQPTPENAQYARALLDGRSLAEWHERPDWKEVVERVGYSDVRSLPSWERAALRMALGAEQTARASTGGPQLRIPKLKKFDFRDAHEASRFILALVEEQGYTCALTGLPLQADGDVEDREFLASLDRIDSDGHYDRKNLQIVCQFVNRWKSDDDSDNFKRLLAAVRR
jgi:hypothetical protein